MRDKVTFPGAKIKKKDQGMPHYDNNHEKGDLYVTFDVAFPKGELPAETKDGWFFSKYFAHTRHHVIILVCQEADRGPLSTHAEKGFSYIVSSAANIFSDQKDLLKEIRVLNFYAMSRDINKV